MKREKLEKEYLELREELVRKNEEEKAQLLEQLDLLKQQQASQSSQASDMSLTNIDDIDGYNVMQSVGMDISNRVVLGEEKLVLSYQPDDNDDVFLNGDTPVSKVHCENELQSTQLGASYTDTFINIHSGDEIAKGLPEHSFYRYIINHVN